jgi:phosphoglycerate dehydrogenase-like enzyme
MALNSRERKIFFGDGRLRMEGINVLEASPIEGAEWAALLHDFRPDAVMSCWSTPMLPVSNDGRTLPTRYLCHLSGSVRGVAPRPLLERGLILSNWGSMVAPEVAEHALLLILASLRSLPQWRDTMQMPWETQAGAIDRLGTRTLRRQRVGLHGFGAIARELVSLLRPFGVACQVYSPGVPTDFIKGHGCEPANGLEELFAGSDVLVECEALTAETAGSVTRELIWLLPHDAVFVNVGRGAVVDDAALSEAASQGRIRLGCDVFADEPIKPSSEFWKARRGVFSPHIAGPTQDSYRACGEFALQNIARFFTGEPVQSVVSLEMYDRST